MNLSNFISNKLLLTESVVPEDIDDFIKRDENLMEFAKSGFITFNIKTPNDGYKKTKTVYPVTTTKEVYNRMQLAQQKTIAFTPQEQKQNLQNIATLLKLTASTFVMIEKYMEQRNQELAETGRAIRIKDKVLSSGKKITASEIMRKYFEMKFHPNLRKLFGLEPHMFNILVLN